MNLYDPISAAGASAAGAQPPYQHDGNAFAESQMHTGQFHGAQGGAYSVDPYRANPLLGGGQFQSQQPAGMHVDGTGVEHQIPATSLSEYGVRPTAAQQQYVVPGCPPRAQPHMYSGTPIAPPIAPVCGGYHSAAHQAYGQHPLQASINKVVFDESRALEKEQVSKGLHLVGESLLNKQMKNAVVPLLKANLCNLVGILRDNKGELLVQQEQRLGLRPKKDLLERVETMLKLPGVLNDMFRGSEATPGEMVMLALVGQELVCRNHQVQNPNAELVQVLSDVLIRHRVDVKDFIVQEIILARLDSLGIKLSPAAGTNIFYLDQAIKDNLVHFNQVFLDDAGAVIDRFATAVAANTQNPQQVVFQIKQTLSRDRAVAPSLGLLLMHLEELQEHLPQHYLAYEFIKVVMTAESVALEKLLAGMNYDVTSDEFKEAAKYFKGIASEQQAKKAFAEMLSSLDGALGRFCRELALQVMDFYSGDYRAGGSAPAAATGDVCTVKAVDNEKPADVTKELQQDMSGCLPVSSASAALAASRESFISLCSTELVFRNVLGTFWRERIISDDLKEEMDTPLVHESNKTTATRLVQMLYTRVAHSGSREDQRTMFNVVRGIVAKQVAWNWLYQKMTLDITNSSKEPGEIFKVYVSSLTRIFKGGLGYLPDLCRSENLITEEERDSLIFPEKEVVHKKANELFLALRQSVECDPERLNHLIEVLGAVSDVRYQCVVKKMREGLNR